MSFLLENWRMLATAFFLVLSFTAGWRVQDWRRDSMETEQREAAQELARENRRGAQIAAAGHEADKERIRTEFITITETVEKIVEKPVYRNVCFDADGMRALRNAIGEPGPATSEPVAAVPGADDAK